MRGAVVSVHVQAALADFLRDGYLRAHIRRMGAVYGARMAAAVAALQRHCGDALTMGEGGGGLQVAGWFRDPAIDDTALAVRLHARGIAVRALSDFHLGPPRPGLLFGIAGTMPQQADAAARTIREVTRGGACHCPARDAASARSSGDRR